MQRSRALLALALVSCGGPSTPSGFPEYSAAEGAQRAETPITGPGEQVPHGQLPPGVTPLSYDLWLEVVPSRERFTGRATIRVRIDSPRSVIWMHGADMNVTDAELLPDGAESVDGTFHQEDSEGTASLRFPQPVGPGEVTLTLTYDAPFDHQLKGLYRVDTGGESYAFTQFESTSARYAFPCFDEPRFKTPFDITLAVQHEHRAISNAHEIDSRDVENGMREVRFATTERLPTYLVAMAVGNLDVVEHAPIAANSVRDRALPLRGVAVHGQGTRLAYALDHTAPLLTYLEQYTGIAYPYDKLDLIAVPDFAAGAMENAGAITFRESLLLLDPRSAPEEQRRGFAWVTAHELAHMWFGDLVTMPWWDDIWLNEAFATWASAKVIAHVHPEYHAELSTTEATHGAMRSDSLASARQIRQPIESNHDIRNAFDSITYRKGGAVLAMFERWLGEETFQGGIREYLTAHRFGSATSEDLLDALGRVAGRDVGTPFRTFLMQPGVPIVQTRLSCEGGHAALAVQQTRYLPIGSTGASAERWQIPFCYRVPGAEEPHCDLLSDEQASLQVEGSCPAWVMPNAGAAGYYHWSLSQRSDLEALMHTGWARTTAPERVSIADNLVAAFDANALPADVVFGALDRIAADPTRAVATAPAGLYSFAQDELSDDAQRERVRRWIDRLYRPQYRRLGWVPRRGEDGETALMRRSIISLLAGGARAADVRREAADRGRRYLGTDGHLHPEAVSTDLASTALALAVQESDAAFFDSLLARALASDDALFRNRALAALGSTMNPELARRALELSADPRLRVNEKTVTLSIQLAQRETREQAWEWLQANFDRVYAEIATTQAGYAPLLLGGFCSEERAGQIDAFFASRIEALPGGPRNLRSALEGIRLCAARAAAQREPAARFFAAQH